MKGVKVKRKIWKRKQTKTHLVHFNCLLFISPLVYRNIFTDDYYPSGYFPLLFNSVSPRMNIASRDKFKPIRIAENLVVPYKGC